MFYKECLRIVEDFKIIKINNCFCFMFILFVHIYIYIYIYIYTYIYIYPCHPWAILKVMRQISRKSLLRLHHQWSILIYTLKMSPLSFLWQQLCAALFTFINTLIITCRTKKHVVVGSKENKRHDLGFNLSKHILNNTLHQITCLYKHS